MVVINMSHITWGMFGLMILTGDMGLLMLWFVIWMPLAMSVKMEISYRNIVKRVNEANNLDNVNIEGSIVRAAISPPPSEDLTVGMSMGES